MPAILYPHHSQKPWPDIPDPPSSINITTLLLTPLPQTQQRLCLCPHIAMHFLIRMRGGMFLFELVVMAPTERENKVMIKGCSYALCATFYTLFALWFMGAQCSRLWSQTSSHHAGPSFHHCLVDVLYGTSISMYGIWVSMSQNGWHELFLFPYC